MKIYQNKDKFNINIFYTSYLTKITKIDIIEHFFSKFTFSLTSVTSHDYRIDSKVYFKLKFCKSHHLK